MPLAPGSYPYSITATRADGVSHTASGTMSVGLGVVAQFGSINNTQTLHPMTTHVGEPPFSVASSPSGTINPGDLVSVTINSGDTTETLSCSAGALAIESNDGSTIQFYAPDVVTFGDRTLTFNSAIEFTITQGAETATFFMVIEPAAEDVFGQVTSIDPDGFYFSDPVTVGDYALIRNISTGLTVNVGTGAYNVTQAASLEYAYYDVVWSSYQTVNFADPNVWITVNTAPTEIKANEPFDLILNANAIVPAMNNISIKYVDQNGPSATINSVSGSDPYTINATFPNTIDLKFSEAGYPLYIEVVEGAATATPTYSDRTKLVTASASGGGDGSEGNPWTLVEAFSSAVAGDIVGIDEGVYVGTGAESRVSPAFEPTNSGTLENPIVFVAKNSAATNSTNLTEIRSGATTQGTGWPAFGVNGQDYIEFIGLKSDNTQANNKTDNDAAPCTLWNTTGSKVLQCEFIGETGISDNYSAVRMETTVDVEVADNSISGYASDTNSAGIIVYKSNGFTVHHNTISNCNNGLQLKGANGADTINDLEIYLNDIDNCTNGIRFHGPVKGAGGELNLVYQNKISNCTRIFEFTSSATHTGEPDGLRIFNNVFYNNAGSDPAAISVAFDYTLEGAVPRDNRLFNNIITGSSSYLGQYGSGLDEAYIAGFIQCENNVLHGLSQFMNGSSSQPLDSATLTSWRAVGQDLNSVITNPSFTNAASGDFTLQAGSSAIDLGADELGKFGAVDATIDAGVYVSGSEVVGVRS